MRNTISIPALFVLAALASAASPTPRGGPASWQLDFEFHDPQRISVRLPGDDHDTTFWYLLYTVTNNTGRDAEFFPSIQLVTDSLQVVEAGADIPPRVFERVKARHVREFPFIAPQTKVTGPLLQGRGNARTSAAIFRMFDPEASAFTVFVAGLSNEVQRINNPSFDASRPPGADNPRSFILRRSLSVSYKLPGDALTRAQAAPVRVSREWIMR